MNIALFNEAVLSPDASVERKWRPHASVSPIVVSDGVAPCHGNELPGSAEFRSYHHPLLAVLNNISKLPEP